MNATTILATFTSTLQHQPLPAEALQQAFQSMFDDGADARVVGEFLLALSHHAVTADMLVVAARFLRAEAHTIQAPAGAADNCGTGGDGLHTLNISTAAALLASACGVTMAKHGNRAVSSQSGSADVLQALNIPTQLVGHDAERALAQKNFCFLMAPLYHPILRRVADVRRALGVRTIFNCLAPLLSPACVKHQVVGVYDQKLLHPVAQALLHLGSEHAWVLHSRDGMDEISLSAPTDYVELKNGQLRDGVIEVEKFGIASAPMRHLRGGNAQHNAAALVRLALGERGAYADSTCLNAAAILVVAQKAADIGEGFSVAQKLLRDGKLNNKIIEMQSVHHG
ncbi:MAG: anthranilate phosphoribosyltransferase [Alphaproteobacteria bacterium]|nr:anthranilate phosphoribosyltransferase [Alphaproteobacteria bacterium]NDG05275.1 anthranilate phosphoribosyltransferase [Alphaproteobacteria bacterium]